MYRIMNCITLKAVLSLYCKPVEIIWLRGGPYDIQGELFRGGTFSGAALVSGALGGKVPCLTYWRICLVPYEGLLWWWEPPPAPIRVLLNPTASPLPMCDGRKVGFGL
jgi:hypothetical protein